MSTTPPGGQAADSDRTALEAVMRRARGSFATVGLFSLFFNLLMLVVPIYMLQVFDRVLSSGHVETLIYLTLAAIFALAVLGLLDAVRGFVLGRLSSWIDDQLSEKLIASSVQAGVAGRPVGAQPLRDLATLRGFVGGPGIVTLFDAPWVPIFLVVIAILHPLLGLIALAAALVLLAVAFLNDRLTRAPLEAAQTEQQAAQAQADSALKQAELVQAMGMVGGLLRRWNAANRDALAHYTRAGDRSAALMGAGKFLRLTVQVLILGAGAFLVLGGDLTPGGMIAASILLGRALAPVEQSLSAWRGYLGARSAYRRMNKLLRGVPDLVGSGMSLPRPRGELTVESLVWLPPGADAPVLRGVQFAVRPGEAVGIIGPSASGKSSLCKLICGIMPPSHGHVRLDGTETWAWRRDEFGRHVGYLPQDVALFDATVRENIARMDPHADPEMVIAAARLAGAERMIRTLPQGFDTRIGAGGVPLSGGQKQRIALARAVYGRPALVVLDEPNANLDKAGETALADAIAALKARGTAVVLAAHKPNVLMQTDRLVVLRGGAQQLYDSRDRVLEKVAGPRFVAAARQKVAGEFTGAAATPGDQGGQARQSGEGRVVARMRMPETRAGAGESGRDESGAAARPASAESGQGRRPDPSAIDRLFGEE